MSSGRIQRLIESRKMNGRLTRAQTKKAQMTEHQPTRSEYGDAGASNEDMDVIMELVDLNKPFPSHPVHVGRLLKEAGITHFSDIQKIGMFRFRITASTKKEKERIQNVKMEHQNLKIYEPMRKNKTICFIRGVPRSFEEEEIQDNLETDYEILHVERIRKRGRDTKLRDTENIKLTVKGQEVPERVKIYGCPFKAELYIFPVRQCRQCWRFGHAIKQCRSRPRCRKCGGRHLEEECEDQEKCVNCGRNHDAQARECPERIRRWKILEKVKDGKTFAEAENIYPKLSNRFANLEVEEEEDQEEDGPGTSTAEIQNKRGDNRELGAGTAKSDHRSRRRDARRVDSRNRNDSSSKRRKKTSLQLQSESTRQFRIRTIHSQTETGIPPRNKSQEMD